MKRFEVFDHTADIGIVAHGSDLKEAFANAAYGMFSLIVELETVQEELQHVIELDATDQESAVVDWLNELLYIFDVEHVVFSRFEVIDLNENKLRAEVYGEKIDLSRHKLKGEVKAATYHSLEIRRENGYRIQVILDM
jgi:SHS2 domain-containing protein